MDKLYQYLASFEIFKDFIWFILGVMTPGLVKFYVDLFKKLRLKHTFRKSALPLAPDTVASLDHGIPYYNTNNIVFKDTNREFYLEIPKEKFDEITELLPRFGDRYKEIYFGVSFDEAFKSTVEILEPIGVQKEYLYKLIETCRNDISEELLKRIKEGQTLFNGEMFGVRNINISRVGEHEESMLKINYYKTNYFTHRVMAEVFQRLKKDYPEIYNFTDNIQSINTLYPFLTSFGIDVLLLFDDDKILLAKRNGHLFNMNGQSKWHVSMNEALSFTDIDYEGKISLNQCVERGLKEELGIDCRIRNSNSYSFYFGDLNIVRPLFEIGMTGLVKMDISLEEIEQYYQVARDSAMETDEIKAISISEIKSFISQNPMTNACKYTLAMWYNRKNIL